MLHCGFIQNILHSLSVLDFKILTRVFRPELDACDSPDKYPQLFQVLLEIEVEDTEKQKDLTPPWEQFPTKDLSPNVLFSSHQENKDALAVTGEIQQQNAWLQNTVQSFKHSFIHMDKSVFRTVLSLLNNSQALKSPEIKPTF